MSKKRKWTMEVEEEQRDQKPDSAIKLFGKTISVMETMEAAAAQEEDREDSDHEQAGVDELGSSAGSNSSGDEQEKPTNDDDREEHRGNLEASNENKQEGEFGSPRNQAAKSEDDNKSSSNTSNDSNNNIDKSKNSPSSKPKKPDKPVSCPRCDSMDTKFCYFNNYNVNQPRHFCKSCQRYWTAGGTLRNVPVGAGRRKSKHAAGGARVQDSRRRDGGGWAATAAASRSSSPSSGGASMSDESQASSSREDCSSSSITQESKAWVGLPVDPAVAAAAAMIGGNWTGLGPWNAGMLVSPLAAAATRTRGRTSQQPSSGSLWVPKSHRIDESGEAAGGAASFLTSLASAPAVGGGNKVSEGSIVAGGMFKAFNSKVQAPLASGNDGVGVNDDGVQGIVAAEEGVKVNSGAEEQRTTTVPTEEV